MYSVARRTPEIGVRMAFGARPHQVVLAVAKDLAVPLILGVGAELAGAAPATRVIRSFLYETEPSDPAAFPAAAAILADAGFLAALIPTLRAARSDPAAM